MERSTISQTDLEAAEEAVLRRDWTKAAGLFQSAHSSGIVSSRTWMSFARILWDLRSQKDAFRAAERAVATSWLESGDLARLLAVHESDVETVEDDNSYGDNAVPWSKQAEETYSSAFEVIERLVHSEHVDAVIWEMHGELLERLRRGEEGLQSYGRALAIEPDRVTCWIALGRILQRLGRLDEAAASYAHGIKFQPGQPRYWAELARIQDKLGNLTQAVCNWDMALALRPSAHYYWSRRAKLLDELGEFDEALQSYDKALQLNPKQASVWSRKARILLKLGRVQEAQQSLEQAASCRHHREVK